VTPPPAPQVEPAADVEALIGAAAATDPELEAYEVVLMHTSAGFSQRTRVVHDGSGRYRVETFVGESQEPDSILLSGPDYGYETAISTDGFTYWRDAPASQWGGRPPEYPLTVGFDCERTWQIVNVELIHGRVADHVSCQGASTALDYWIDRDTRLVLRVQTVSDDAFATSVEEVVELRFGPSLPELFELPPGAEVRD
jgi:hypothetical protein